MKTRLLHLVLLLCSVVSFMNAQNGEDFYYTFDNQRIIIPNGLLSNGCVTNINVNGTRRVDMVFGIAYDADINEARAVIQAVADAHGLRVIADGAQAFGGKDKGRWVGNLAEITATSFYPTKALGGYGDGGAILCQDKDFADRMRSIRWHGTGDNRKESVRVGINGRCDSIQCAVVAEKLDLFEPERARRIAAAAIYNQRLDGVVGLQSALEGQENGYGLYTVRVPNRTEVRAKLSDQGIPSGIYYDMAIHQMPAFSHLAETGSLPVCEAAAEDSLSLPMHPYMSAGQVHKVCDVLMAAVQG